MNSIDARQLFDRLLTSDTEQEVITVLTDANLWDDMKSWRLYGDTENNWSEAGNQQSRSDAALVEKIVNSIDARLMNECMVAGIDPEGPTAPRSIREAVATFIEKHPQPKSDEAGRIRNWSSSTRTNIARDITLAATGNRPKDGKPCFTIVDKGEGQTPDRFPDTLLSLNRSNKLRIPFVQGKFNMGGTGVLKFCGKHNLQLVLSRRNPELLSPKQQTIDHLWGFTVVRRNDPVGMKKSSTYTYLAPLDADENPTKGRVLRFEATSLKIFPHQNEAYARESDWGTLIKLYEYANSGYSNTNILLGDGLMERIDILLPELALPIRLHECRKGFSGHAGSFDTTVNGLSVRLSDDKFKNLEEGFPTSAPIGVGNEKMTATVFAFKPQKAQNYRKSEGIVFVLGGQTQGHFTTDFFRRKSVNLSYLRTSILVMVDCTEFSGRAREDFFMNSRDRLSAGELRSYIETSLEELLRTNKGLRELAERRRRDEIKQTLEDNKPLKALLENLIKQSPTLASLFAIGGHVTNPFKSASVAAQDKPYVGKVYPTFFKFKDKKIGEILVRDVAVNMRARITFETDAVNEYFDHSLGKGAFVLRRQTQAGDKVSYLGHVGPNLHNGSATLSVHLPDNCEPGDVLTFECEVTDESRVEPFLNCFTLAIKDAIDTSGGHGHDKKPPGDKKGADHDVPQQIALPEVVLVEEKDWGNQDPPFDKFSSLRIRQPTGTGEVGNGGPAYDFFVNIDNVHLLRELKVTKDTPELVKKRFEIALTLLGLGLIQDEQQKSSEQTFPTGEAASDGEGQNLEDRVEQFTRAVAPVLLPMITGLGGMQEEHLASSVEEAGEAV